MTKRKPILALNKYLHTVLHEECIVERQVCTQLYRSPDRAAKNIVSGLRSLLVPTYVNRYHLKKFKIYIIYLSFLHKAHIKS